MSLRGGKKIVLLGAMGRRPWAGLVWQTVHYLIGFQRLGYDVYYVEAHGEPPLVFMQHEHDDGSVRVAAFIDRVMRRFDLGERWAFHALHADGRCYGLSEGQLKQLYRSAELIINLHGGTLPLPEHSETGRLVYLETDPVIWQVWLHDNVQWAIDYLEPHCAFFTFGENYGNPDCKVPVSERFDFRPTRQPVVLDFWQQSSNSTGEAFTTVGNWQQLGRREVDFQGEVYHWSKHYEFLKFIDLPKRAEQVFELALSKYDATDKYMLEDNGWRVRSALGLSTDTEPYHRYIAGSRGEFTVAKDQNVRLRSGWFSDRSATYLAAGRPVITQETGFSNILPTGEGLFAFSSMEEILQALESINSAYEHHRRAARALAQEYFNYEVVLSEMLAELGLPHSAGGLRGETGTRTDESLAKQDPANLEERAAEESNSPFPPSLVLDPISRHPTELPETTIRTVLARSATISPACYDVVCFHAVDRDLHSKRLQEVMAQFAHHGHRVFCLKLDSSLAAPFTGHFRTHTLAPNLFEIPLAAGQVNVDGGAIESQDTLLLEALKVLRRTYRIEEAIVYVQPPSWGAQAMLARQRWGWKVVYGCMNQWEDSPFVEHSLTEEELLLEGQADLVIQPAVALKKRDSEHTERDGVPPQRHTWAEPWQQLDKSIRLAFERASIVIVTFNNLVFTRLCLQSLLANTEYPNYEIIVIDNGSTDATPAYLRSLRQQYPHVRVFFNDHNLGFARANNQGLALATGEVLVLLNNDTIVPSGWLTRLIRYLKDPNIGLVGPVTNNAANEAQIDIPYRTYGEYAQFVRDHTQAHEGELFDIQTLTMFCVAMRREMYERIGSLDERFGVGTFEDDDYAMRVRSGGYRVVCTEEVFVHHFGKASFGRLVPTGDYGKLLWANRRLFEEKWGIPWHPHRRRLSQQYQQLTDRIREVVRTALPSGAPVIVVSKGDGELLQLDGRQAWHFPQNEQGEYAGYYPADSAAAIDHLEELRAKGGGFLLFPSTALWWLEHYGEFKQHVESQYRTVVCQEDTCVIFALHDSGYPRSDSEEKCVETHSSQYHSF